jgi:hypothetical protein
MESNLISVAHRLFGCGDISLINTIRHGGVDSKCSVIFGAARLSFRGSGSSPAPAGAR